MALIPFRMFTAAVFLSACLSGCREKSVFQRNVVTARTLTQISEVQRSVTPPELPGPPDSPPGVTRMRVLETPAERFTGGLPEETRSTLPGGIPAGPRMRPPQPEFTRIFEPPDGIDASPAMRELEVMKDLKLIKEREIRASKE